MKRCSGIAAFVGLGCTVNQPLEDMLHVLRIL